MSETLSLLEKYDLYIRNIQWHIKTNEPKGDKLKILQKRITDYKEVVHDLKRLSTLSPYPLTEDELKAKFAHYIGGDRYTYDQLDTSERDTLEWVLKELNKVTNGK